MTQTIYEIVGNTEYSALTDDQREMMYRRQNVLVVAYQNGNEDAFEELYDSLKDYIRGTAYRRAMKGFSIEREDIEGIINVVLVESIIKFDISLGKPFHPFFAMAVNNEMKMVYRAKSKDMHDSCLSDGYRLDRQVESDSSVKDLIQDKTDDTFARILAEQIMDACFGNDQKKRTIVHMFLDGFRQREIAAAIKGESENIESVYKYVKRTVTLFRQHAIEFS